MLVMTRKRDESIVIGADIEIFVVDIRGDKVRLGVKAPLELPVHRREVFEILCRADAAANRAPFEARPAASASSSDAASEFGLSLSQLAFLDRLREAIGARGGATPCRAQTLSAVLSALDEAEETFGGPATLEQLKSSIVAAIKGATARE
jgi:carbon storage regulator